MTIEDLQFSQKIATVTGKAIKAEVVGFYAAAKPMALGGFWCDIGCAAACAAGCAAVGGGIAAAIAGAAGQAAVS
jgi:hypothetical protein